jgi:hypothetical protein
MKLEVHYWRRAGQRPTLEAHRARLAEHAGWI